MTEVLFRQDAYAQQCEATVVAADERGVVLDRTVFYPTGGGQPGDRGLMRLADGGEVTVVDTVKGEGAAIVHRLAEGAQLPAVGSRVSLTLD